MNAEYKRIAVCLFFALTLPLLISASAVAEEFPLLLGQKTVETNSVSESEPASNTEGETLSPEREAFAKDPDADVGDIIRAGCQPTLEQMSALMDNPLGNVAMLFTQFDVYRMTNDNVTDSAATKSV